jgi:hypothetical protein
MRTLNRPMFRYGGPIKEGVMSGIREPKKNGGPTGTGLVGDQRYPQTNGREHHGFFIPPALAVGAGLNALRMGAMRMAPRAIQGVRNFFKTQVGTKSIPKQGPTLIDKGKFVPTKNVRIPSSGSYSGVKFKPGKNIGTGTAEMPTYAPNYLGRDPLVRLVGGTYKAVTSPAATGALSKVARFATSPSSIIAGTAYYLWPDGKERKTPPPLGDSGRVGTSGAPGGGHPGMFLTPQVKGGEQDPPLPEKSAEELRKEQVQRYRDIMDIKGMNKNAAYNSLIAASQLINQEGDFKGSLKDGSLISKIIGATSKAFDKPAQTKDAIDTLILKGEIEKDLNKEKNALENEYKRSAIALNEAKIAQDSLMGDRKSYLEKNKALPSGQMLAGLARNRGYKVAGIEDVTEVKNWMKENGGDEVDYLKDIMTKTEIAPGVYVINTRLIKVTEDNKLQEV